MLRQYGINHEVAAKLERRYRLSWDNRARLLRALGNEMDRLKEAVLDEEIANKKNNTYERDQKYGMEQLQILAMTLGEDRPEGGRRNTWIWRGSGYDSKWCREKADELERLVKAK